MRFIQIFLLICKELFEHNIQSVIVEGGAATLQRFIDAALWDEAIVFTGLTNFNAGTEAPKKTSQFTLQSSQHIQGDRLDTYTRSDS